jgi:hypothetical protein
MEIPMKTFATAFCVLNVGILFSSAVYGQPMTEQPRFQIEIHATGERGPTYTVTNLSGKRVSACVIEISSSSQSGRKLKTVWDALLQDELVIEPGASISQNLPHVVGDPLPDRVEVIAGVWTDGETFGQIAWANNILKTRAMRVSEYEQAVAVLQNGLDENWTINQYLQVLSDRPNSGPVQAIRSTLAANQQNAEKPQLLRHVIQMMLESFVQKSNQLRMTKPIANSASS